MNKLTAIITMGIVFSTVAYAEKPKSKSEKASIKVGSSVSVGEYSQGLDAKFKSDGSDPSYTTKTKTPIANGSYDSEEGEELGIKKNGLTLTRKIKKDSKTKETTETTELQIGDEDNNLKASYGCNSKQSECTKKMSLKGENTLFKGDFSTEETNKYSSVGLDKDGKLVNVPLSAPEFDKAAKKEEGYFYNPAPQEPTEENPNPNPIPLKETTKKNSVDGGISVGIVNVNLNREQEFDNGKRSAAEENLCNKYSDEKFCNSSVKKSETIGGGVGVELGPKKEIEDTEEEAKAKAKAKAKLTVSGKIKTEWTDGESQFELARDNNKEIHTDGGFRTQQGDLEVDAEISGSGGKIGSTKVGATPLKVEVTIPGTFYVDSPSEFQERDGVVLELKKGTYDKQMLNHRSENNSEYPLRDKRNSQASQISDQELEKLSSITSENTILLESAMKKDTEVKLKEKKELEDAISSLENNLAASRTSLSNNTSSNREAISRAYTLSSLKNSLKLVSDTIKTNKTLENKKLSSNESSSLASWCRENNGRGGMREMKNTCQAVGVSVHGSTALGGEF